MNITKSYSHKKRYGKRTAAKQNKSQTSLDFSKYINEGTEATEPTPYTNSFLFSDFGLAPSLRKLIEDKGYRTPSEIQDKSIIPIMEGSDLVGIAGTGTGKTAAFLIPIIQQLIEKDQANHALIITPTRELANQINDEFRSLTKGLNLFSTCLIGGSSVSEGLKSLKRKNHLIVGTPGRLQDMAKQGALHDGAFKVLVLDEFDRMLDMGFSKEILHINSEMVKKEQTLLFSATLDPSQKRLVEEITTKAVRVQSAHTTQGGKSIHQQVIRSNGQDKFTLVKNILSDPISTKTILFCETKRHTEKMLKMLTKEQFKADAIHGNKSQRSREIALSRFRKGQINILVATDVVARGIDVSDVELVINYQPPRNYADYVHRIGRTGRAGKKGRAITLID